MFWFGMGHAGMGIFSRAVMTPAVRLAVVGSQAECIYEADL